MFHVFIAVSTFLFRPPLDGDEDTQKGVTSTSNNFVGGQHAVGQGSAHTLIDSA